MQRNTLSIRSLVIVIALALMIGAARPVFSQTESVLYTFQGGTNAAVPWAGLIRDSAGNFYGTTLWGGTYNDGTVFKLDRHGKETVLYSFAGGSDGIAPQAPLIRDATGNLYGTTKRGGAADAGVVFKIDANRVETVLYTFTGGADGGTPLAGLIRDRAGNLYGTTAGGGDTSSSCVNQFSGCGTVFKVSPARRETVLHTFGSGTDGRNPQGGLVWDSAGNIYGTTLYGGANTIGIGYGTVFKIDRTRTETVLYSFQWGNGTDGGLPSGHLGLDSAGNLYGTTQTGGDPNACFQYGCGTVFRVDSSGNETVLYAFKDEPDGADPDTGVVRDAVGNLYGTTYAGGPGGLSGFGTVFKVDATGHETILHSFSGGTDGANPDCTLLLDSSGNLYGTTTTGGPLALEEGVIFRIKP
jgi:uncharacterized repeat protein (TIGR03803 family)